MLVMHGVQTNFSNLHGQIDLGICKTGFQYYEAGGSLSSTVVFLNGLATPQFIWGPLLKLWNPENSFLTFDYPSRGTSGPTRQRLILSSYSGQLAELMEGLKITGPVHLVGYSFGALVATAFAAMFPQKVQSLSLIAPLGFDTPDLGSLNLICSLPRPVIHPICRMLKKSIEKKTLEVISLIPDLNELWKAYPPLLINRDYINAIVDTVNLSVKPVSIELYISNIHYYRIRTMLIWGDNDTYVPLSDTPETMGLTEKHIISGGTHFVALSHAGEVMGLLREFWGRDG